MQISHCNDDSSEGLTVKWSAFSSALITNITGSANFT